MRLPFGLDLKTAIVTLLFVYLVLPWIMAFVGRARGGSENA